MLLVSVWLVGLPIVLREMHDSMSDTNTDHRLGDYGPCAIRHIVTHFLWHLRQTASSQTPKPKCVHVNTSVHSKSQTQDDDHTNIDEAGIWSQAACIFDTDNSDDTKQRWR